MKEDLIGQALVTDPGVSGASGYILVAASPEVTAEDRQQLATVSQVSDYLHLESSPRVFFSFFRLPSGTWAFGKRFIRGTRRGSFNRIVVHSLVLSEEVLEALGWEPWLLPMCSFEAHRSGAVMSFQNLTQWAGEQAPRELADLHVILPEGGLAKRFEASEARRKYLRDRWGVEHLEAALCQVLGALEERRRLLLPQTQEHEQLLALAWSSLPRKDRREIPWTSHLAPGTGALFRLANAPSPEEARASEDAKWSVLGEPCKAVGGAVIARSLALGTPPWRTVAADWFETTVERGLSLARNGPQVQRWVAWLEHGGAPAEGFRSLRKLRDYLADRAVDSSSAEDPWESPLALLLLSAATVANLTRGGESRQSSATGVYKLLAERNLQRTVLQPESFEGLAELTTDPEILLAALDLALKPARSDPQRARLLLVAISAAWRWEKDDLAGRIAAEYFAPLLTDLPALAPLVEEKLDVVLNALRACPRGLTQAISGWRDALYDRAVKELREWTRKDPEAAWQAAEPFAESPDLSFLQERPSLFGLAERLAEANIPAESWLPFALVEAAVVDAKGDALEMNRFSAFLVRSQFPEKEARAAAAALCRRLHRDDLSPREAHRAMVDKIAPALAGWPDEVVAAFARLERLSDDAQFCAWCPSLVRVANALDRRGRPVEASSLLRNWWIQLAIRPVRRSEEVPNEAFVLIRGLSESDQKHVAAVWSQRLADLAWREDTVSKKLFEQLSSDPEYQLHVEIGGICARIRDYKLSLAEGVAVLAERLRLTANGKVRLGDIVAELLPKESGERVKTLLGLLLSPLLLPSTRRSLRGRFLDSTLRTAKDRLFWGLPPVALLQGRGELLMRVFYLLGEIWPEGPFTCYDFLKEATKLGRLDAVGAFLHGAESVRRPRSFFAQLGSEEGDATLVAVLKGAARNPVHRQDLRPFLPRIATLSVRNS